MAYKPNIIYEPVKEVDFSKDIKIVKTSKKEYESHCVIVAMGRNPRELGLPQEKELKGLGVSYCATCDGNFFKNKDVAVVGGGDTAVTEAVYLSRICKKVYIVHRRDTFRAAQAEIDKLKSADNIELVLNARVSKLLGDNKIEGIEVSESEGSESDKPSRILDVSAVFVAIGAAPNSKVFEGILTLDEQGYIIGDDEMRTNITNIFVAGDIRKKSLRQVITAASDGAVAAHNVMLAIQDIPIRGMISPYVIP